MCDTCSDFIQLLLTYETKITREPNEQAPISTKDVDIVNSYVQAWSARQCMCCYRDSKNLERFSYVTQGLIFLAVCHCKILADKGSESTATKQDGEDKDLEEDIQDTDKLLNLISKIFLLNFPLYVAYKHTIQTKIDELTQQEMQSLNLFCDLHDSEIPIYLLKNVSWFCKIGGLIAMTSCFTMLTPDLLPVTTAHAMISVVCNLKLWMNYKSMVTMLVPLRSCVLRYMCKLSDRDLRTPTIKSMADFMWNAIKDPLDTPVAFDVDGLDLAFKYFTSSTLTMRLAGITQINNQIGVLAEICVGEAIPEAEAAPRLMADWLIANNIISHIFGPNLHVEVIKQSHIILNFLAMEGRITCAHMDVIWAAAQLKHCAKPVHDLLPGLVKHLAAAPTLHLYNLLTKLEPKDHTEQTLYLASALIKAVWSRGGTALPDAGLINLTAANAGLPSHKCTSSENSVSLDASNSEEDHGDSTAQSESHKSDSEDIDGVEIEDDVGDATGPPPCKLARKHLMRRPHCIASSSDPEIDGIPIKRGISEKTKKSLVAKAKNSKRQQELAVRKKLMTALNIVIPEPANNVASSSSQEEVDDEDQSVKLRKRRKLLRKNRLVKRRKGKGNTGGRLQELSCEGPSSEIDVESDREIDTELIEAKADEILATDISSIVETNMKQPYLEESSSGSEIGKVLLVESREEDMNPNYFSVNSRAHILEMLSGEEAEIEGDNDGSYSSRMSNKSEKNMADFDGEDSVCEEELVQLAVRVQMNTMTKQSSPDKSPVRVDPCLSSNFKADNVCQPGNTLLWDLLQDDKIGQLGEGLALEAEKTLCNLISYTSDKEIRMKFIEGCLKNLENHNSVVVSLRMLPKLLTSFRGMDLHNVTHWAEKQLHMMKHFFNDLKAYTADPANSLCLYSHQMQIQVRLHFLSAIFSPIVSPSSFKLSIEQVDTLWECLAHDPECSDELFSWLLSQTKTNELHALKIDALRRLYVHHLPSLPLEKFSMICLSLFQHLCSLNHLLMVSPEAEYSRNSHNVGMDHMWKIALRATNTDVSMAAMQYINSYYLSHNLQHEGQFMKQCMTHLNAATEDLISATGPGSEEPPMLRIQRALLLMKSHLDAFKRRYAYHLRKWALEGNGIGSHSATLGDRPGTPIRLIIQSGSSTERCFLDMSSADYVADLRAEIVNWCESLSTQSKDSEKNPTMKSGETWIRIITQGQELTIDCDEKTLGEMGFKDNQMIYISVGVSRNMKKREFLDSPSMQPPPPRESIPALLLLQPNYFEQLFSLMHTLSSMKTHIKGGRQIPHTKAQVLSRRVWDILSILPTSPTLLSGFQKLDTPLNDLLNPSSAQKLMYSLYIIESLSVKNSSIGLKDKGEDPNIWCEMFIKNGGLRHLYDIFMSGVLQRDGGDGCEWQQDCLASLLKTICQLGVEHWACEVRQTRNDKIIIPNLNEVNIKQAYFIIINEKKERCWIID
ncbi:hypothetical protein WA026_007695 [Henosepilachna vigintioctopunctata]|uniref:Ubiquitinyl hydrolase 1 n=1 Tax=Henosepilachna vigintioctopunctata TaxID=420089 RepID=A0AAW1U4X6_9CUCU